MLSNVPNVNEVLVKAAKLHSTEFMERWEWPLPLCRFLAVCKSKSCIMKEQYRQSVRHILPVAVARCGIGSGIKIETDLAAIGDEDGEEDAERPTASAGHEPVAFRCGAFDNEDPCLCDCAMTEEEWDVKIRFDEAEDIASDAEADEVVQYTFLQAQHGEAERWHTLILDAFSHDDNCKLFSEDYEASAEIIKEWIKLSELTNEAEIPQQTRNAIEMITNFAITFMIVTDADFPRTNQNVQATKSLLAPLPGVKPDPWHVTMIEVCEQHPKWAERKQTTVPNLNYERDNEGPLMEAIEKCKDSNVSVDDMDGWIKKFSGWKKSIRQTLVRDFSSECSQFLIHKASMLCNAHIRDNICLKEGGKVGTEKMIKRLKEFQSDASFAERISACILKLRDREASEARQDAVDDFCEPQRKLAEQAAADDGTGQLEKLRLHLVSSKFKDNVSLITGHDDTRELLKPELTDFIEQVYMCMQFHASQADLTKCSDYQGLVHILVRNKLIPDVAQKEFADVIKKGSEVKHAYLNWKTEQSKSTSWNTLHRAIITWNSTPLPSTEQVKFILAVLRRSLDEAFKAFTDTATAKIDDTKNILGQLILKGTAIAGGDKNKKGDSWKASLESGSPLDVVLKHGQGIVAKADTKIQRIPHSISEARRWH